MAERAKNYLVDYHRKTLLSQHEFCFKWTVENFSLFFFNDEENSPTFYSKHHSSKLKLCREDSFLRLTVQHSKSRKLIEEEWNTSVLISDTAGNVFYDESVKDVWLGDNINKRQFFPNIEIDFGQVAYHIVTFIVNVKLITKADYDILPDNDRQADMRNAFIDDVLKVREDKIGTDVVLRVQGDEIKVHKMILSARSPVFARMFCNQMSEAETNVVDIEDIGINAMRELVNFMYCKLELDYNFETAMEVYYAADKYEMKQLREFCSSFLAYRLTVDNVCRLMQSAERHNDRELRREVFKFIKSNFKDVVKTEWWIQIVREKTDLCDEIVDYVTR